MHEQTTMPNLLKLLTATAPEPLRIPIQTDPNVDVLQLKAVVKALVSEVPSLAGSGFTNQGHWYECENGHPYIITECGGATQASMCPECGAPIGGTQHRLQAGNRESAALRALAAQVAGQRL